MRLLDNENFKEHRFNLECSLKCRCLHTFLNQKCWRKVVQVEENIQINIMNQIKIIDYFLNVQLVNHALALKKNQN